MTSLQMKMVDTPQRTKVKSRYSKYHLHQWHNCYPFICQLTRSFGVLHSHNSFLWDPQAQFLNVSTYGNLVEVVVHLIVCADVYFCER